MTSEEIAKKEADDAAAAEAEKAKANPDPLKAELDKVQNKSKFTESEKAAKALVHNARRAKELGLDPLKVLGLEEEVEVDDDKPLTHGDLRKHEVETAQKTALDRANEIENETERELVKHHLVNTIRPSGSADTDLSNARAIVNSVRNGQIAEEAMRKTNAKRNSSASGAPIKDDGAEFEPTKEESAFMKPPFNLTKEKILEARKKAQ